ncbi:Riboflavin transporter RibZ [Microbacterium oxydans]|uniref:MFS transporter n=1 Tax=Microbacterium oxydans TaxID=82380 RepID=UPI001DFCD530|nr:MFS transporter [Microbacterium oxydans]CAH0191069.1 Riboflavin transporter RibZ [Microbacterium oxydans]
MTAIDSNTPRLRAGLGGLALSVLVASLGTSAANVALPTIAVELGGAVAQTQWVAVAYLLAMTATSLTVGYLGDLLGRRRVLLIGIAIFSVAALLSAFAPTLGTLIAARALQGVGAAVMMALPLARARDLVPAERLGSAMGLLGTTAAVGTASGPALGGVLITVAGWPAIFAIMAPLGAAAALLTWRTHEAAPARAERRRFDVAGVLLLTGAVACYTLGVTTPGAGEQWPTAALAGGAVILLLLFILRERRAAHPVLQLALLRTRAISIGAVLNLIVGAVMMTTLVVGPFFLAGALHLSPAATGAVMAAGPIASMCTGVLAGRAVDRFGTRPMTTTGLSAMIAGSLALALLPAWWGLPGYITGTVLLAPGYQLFLAANTTGVLAATPADRRGVTSGLLGLSRNLGLVTGASLLPALFTTASGSIAVGAAGVVALTSGLRITFLTATAALAVAVLLSLVRSRDRASG